MRIFTWHLLSGFCILQFIDVIKDKSMRAARKRNISFIDAFAGCGGLSLGLMQAGLTGLFAIEHDKFAFASLQANLLRNGAKYRFRWPKWLPREPIAIGDAISDFRSELKELEGKVDVLAGGPPCQGFSSAGRRKHGDPRNELFRSYVEFVEILQPRIVLIENVRGFTMDFQKQGRIDNYAEQLRNLLSANYDVHEELLDLSEFGVPQHRTRYFLLAAEPGLGVANPFQQLRDRLPSYLRSLGLCAPVTSWAAISDLEVSRGGRHPSSETSGFSEIGYLGPQTHYQRLMNEGTASPSDLRLARHSEEIVSRFEEIIELSHAEGRLNTTISEDVRRRFGLRKQALRVLDPDRPSPTITSMPDDLIHYREPRTLTVRENARLQGFPDWFEFKGKYTTGGDLRRREVPRFTQVANAVPPLVARAIGELVKEILREDQQKRVTSKNSRLSAKRTMKLPELVT